jgi:hypothetical protein
MKLVSWSVRTKVLSYLIIGGCLLSGPSWLLARGDGDGHKHKGHRKGHHMTFKNGKADRLNSKENAFGEMSYKKQMRGKGHHFHKHNGKGKKQGHCKHGPHKHHDKDNSDK